MLEYFLSICKNDCVKKGFVGEVIQRFEKSGLQLIHVEWMWLTREQVVRMYLDKQDEPFFDDLLAYMLSGPVVITVWQGDRANERGRQQVGAKDPVESEAGSIRGSMPAVDKIHSFVHGSRSPMEAQAEMEILLPNRFDFAGAPSPAADRPEGDAPYAPGELAAPPPLMKPWLDPWENDEVRESQRSGASAR